MLIIVMALSGCRSDDRTRNRADAARRSKVTTDLETKDQGSLRRLALCRDVTTVAMATCYELFVNSAIKKYENDAIRYDENVNVRSKTDKYSQFSRPHRTKQKTNEQTNQ